MLPSDFIEEMMRNQESREILSQLSCLRVMARHTEQELAAIRKEMAAMRLMMSEIKDQYRR